MITYKGVLFNKKSETSCIIAKNYPIIAVLWQLRQQSFWDCGVNLGQILGEQPFTLSPYSHPAKINNNCMFANSCHNDR